MPTDSEIKLALWAINSGLPLEAFWSSSDEERRALVEKLAREHYKKGLTESYIRQVNRLWRDIEPTITQRSEEVAVEPRLARLERVVITEVNTRRELAQARTELGEIPRERLSPERSERYGRVEGTLTQIDGIMTELESEFAMRGQQPLITTAERREEGVSELLRAARREGVSSAGGRIVGESNIRYRLGVTPRTFTVREYPVSYDAKTQTWSEQPRYRVSGEGIGYVGSFSTKPSARQIREKWRS